MLHLGRPKAALYKSGMFCISSKHAQAIVWYHTIMTVIDDSLKALDPSQRLALERIRKIVKQAVPDAEDTISYGMPALKYKGKYLIAFAAFKNHLSLFPGALPDEPGPELAAFKTSKGTLQFTVDKPIPDDVIKKLVKKRMQGINAQLTQ